MSVHDRQYEMMLPAEREQVQLERLQALLVRLKRNVRRYRERLGDARVASLDDLPRLPMTAPEDLADCFPYGMFAFPLREIIRLHPALGPEGRPLVMGHTRNDLLRWGRLTARQLVASGVTAYDVIQIGLGQSSHHGQTGYVLGAECIEASVIAEDPFHLDHQLAMLQRYRPTILITTPTNARELIRLMEERRVDPQSLHLRTVLLSRQVDAPTREQLATGLFAAVNCNFGVGELLDPGLCAECECGQFHVHDDHFLVEIHEGELVVTTLSREALPLLRYRTRIACDLVREKCGCGRTGAVIRPGRRLDRRLLVNETPFYECQVAEVLAQTEAAGRPFQIEVSERHIVVQIEMSADLMSDTIWVVERLTRAIESEFLARLGIQAKAVFTNPHGRSGGPKSSRSAEEGP
jgi:phenylacetate-CoA ligase